MHSAYCLDLDSQIYQPIFELFKAIEMITKLAFIELQNDIITCGSKVGKNLQFIGNIFEASTLGTPGSCRTLHISSNGLLHAS